MRETGDGLLSLVYALSRFAVIHTINLSGKCSDDLDRTCHSFFV